MSDDEKPQYIVTSPGADDQPPPFATQLAAGLSAVRVSSTSSSKLVSSRNISQTTRSHSLQSSSSSSSTVVSESSSSTVQSTSTTTSTIHKQIQPPTHQHKTLSTSNLAAAASGTVFNTKVTKGKFQSFLQHPEDQASHHGTTFVTSHQKHHQFVRSSSAHSEGGNGTGTSGTSGGSIDFDTSIKKPDHFTRSSSTQIDEHSDQHAQQNQTHLLATAGSSNKTALHHVDHHSTGNLHREVSSILISKSAETIESRSIASGVMRSQLTLSGGFLAPPNRKLTILSPIHAPPGLHEMLTRRHGRSPLSPRVGFAGSEMDLFP